MEQQALVKTELDKDYDGTEETYEKILLKRKEFTIKINNKQIIIKKCTLDKIMILSDSQQEKQILFTHYKTLENENQNHIDNLNNNLISNYIMKSKKQNSEKIEDSLISFNNVNKPLLSNNNNNLVKKNSPVIEEENGIDNLMCIKTEIFDDNMKYGLPSQAISTKWIYLLLALFGVVYVIYFFYCLFQPKLFKISFLILIFGFIISFTGLYGKNKVGHKIYDNQLLKYLTLLCIFLPVINFVLIVLISGNNFWFWFGLTVCFLTIDSAFLCYYFTNQLSKYEDYIRGL